MRIISVRPLMVVMEENWLKESVGGPTFLLKIVKTKKMSTFVYGMGPIIHIGAYVFKNLGNRVNVFGVGFLFGPFL